MMTTIQLFNFICLALMVTKVTSQSLLTGNGIGLPELRNYLDTDNNHRIFLHHQAIIPTYSFDSCGNITEWGADVYLDDQMYSLDFQVWRPSPTVDDSTDTGCYSLVGNNRFTSISLSNGIVIVTPSPQDYIMFQPRDVLGFYVESANIREPGKTLNGLVLQTSPSRFTSELVWYASIAPTSASLRNCVRCPNAIRCHNHVSLTRAAPVISIGLTTYPCRVSSFTHTSSLSILSPTSTSMKATLDHLHPTTTQSTAMFFNTHISTSQVPINKGTLISPYPITMQSMHTSVTVSPSAPSRVGQTPWVFIGCITAAVLVVITLIVSCTAIIVVCFLKRRGPKGGQAVDEHYYDCVYGLSAQASNYPQKVTKNPKSIIDTKVNEAYATNEWSSNEFNQNVAYDIFTRIMIATESDNLDHMHI